MKEIISYARTFADAEEYRQLLGEQTLRDAATCLVEAYEAYTGELPYWIVDLAEHARWMLS